MYISGTPTSVQFIVATGNTAATWQTVSSTSAYALNSATTAPSTGQHLQIRKNQLNILTFFQT